MPPPASTRPEVERPRPARTERNNGPSPRGELGSSTRGEPLPGEHLLAQLAEDLQAAHPRGLAGGTDLHQALLRALKSGDLRPDGTAAKPGLQSLTVSELRERHAAWCTAWASGASLPMNLANWINKKRCHEQPPATSTHGNPPPEIAQSLAELANRHEESVRTLDWGEPA